jgi:hypothetical protein
MAMSPRLLRPRASAGYGLDARDWQSRVVANGGSVSATTMKAVDTFCKAIVTAGIRDRFYRLNLFAGSNLNAALVPLFRGPDRTGTQFGNATDTNTNFVSGDYTETGATGGLTAPASNATKHLNTGFTVASLPTLSSVHLSVYHRKTNSTSTRDPIGIVEAAAAARYAMRLSAANYSNGWLGDAGNLFENTIAFQPGLVVVSRESNTFAGSYHNNASFMRSVTSTASPVSSSWPVFVFGSAQTSSTPNTGALFDAPMMGYSIGAGLTSAQVSAYYTALQAFQTALTRQA